MRLLLRGEDRKNSAALSNHLGWKQEDYPRKGDADFEGKDYQQDIGYYSSYDIGGYNRHVTSLNENHR